MNRHGSRCLEGPISADRAWWANLLPTPGETSCDEPRIDLINRVRSEIDAGTYETEEKWSFALEQLLRHLDRS
jgi:hypothetical protein